MIGAIGDVYIVIDALDECKNRKEHQQDHQQDYRQDLLAWIKGFREDLGNVHILVTGRPEEDIKSAIESWAYNKEIVSLRNDRIGGDITEYIRTEVRGSEQLAC